MHFKDWCLSQYGIVNFLEAKTLNRVFIPLIYSSIDAQFVAEHNGYLTTHNNHLGLVIPKENYDLLIFRIYLEFQQTYPGVNDPNDFEKFSDISLFKLGLNRRGLTKYKQPSNIRVTFSDDSLKTAFTKQFVKYNPQLKLDPLTYAQVVEMPPYFMGDIYQLYYQSPAAEISRTTDLAQLKAQEATLKKLLQEVNQNKLILDSINKLTLDYDNFGDHPLSNRQACEAYALSLRVFAEANRDNLSTANYQALINASTFLVARDEFGKICQSLGAELEFASYIRDQLYEHARTQIPGVKDENPLFHELPPPYDKRIPELIKNNVRDLLEGNSWALMNRYSKFISRRFLPDQQNPSQTGTDEILIRGGAQKHHFALFRIIKVGLLENGQMAEPGEKPHHYEYYKVENNLGFMCPGVDVKTKTGWGTFITKLTPFTYDSQGNLAASNVGPFTQPELYQASMEITLRELIRVEREIVFYRQNGRDVLNSKEPQNTKEADEWVRLFELRQRLSGYFYPLSVKYYVQDPINSHKQHERFVSNQRGFVQEDGSCPAFTLKSWLASTLGHSLNSLLNHFMQQHNANEQARALQAALSRVQGRIRELDPLEIKGTSRDNLMNANRFFSSFMVPRSLPIAKQPEERGSLSGTFR
ncbi:hypothetical protein Lnau_2534 [Legionella nautarum]|uniref:Uncharacterized protein n=1 Tax=Legionella nautarum TaxID=45070 RepID=A0A0W0WLA6_9GAMM|nr:hypothetical protein [Legionella nautarum]KTD32886.1 hypothetical protein Lnau_2534 [Legionella nautarum]